jgi:hypothetical protein
MNHSANAWRHNEKPNCQSYWEHNTQMQKSLQESANFYRAWRWSWGRRESISRADHKTNPFHWVSVVGILSALHCCCMADDIPTGHSWKLFLRAGIEESVLGYPMVQSQAEFPISHHPKPGPDRIQVRSFQVSSFWGQTVFVTSMRRLSSQFALAVRSRPTPNSQSFSISF